MIAKFSHSRDIQLLKDELAKVSPESRAAVKIVFKFLLDLSQQRSSLFFIFLFLSFHTISFFFWYFSELNKMDKMNIGIVFGPTFFKQDPSLETPMSSFSFSNMCADLIVFFLDSYHELFSWKKKKKESCVF